MTHIKQNFAQELLKSQLEIQEETLRHFVKEIHDNIGQLLSLAKLQLSNVLVTPLEQNREAIEQSKYLVGQAITDLRGLSRAMYPDRVNELGLEENIRQELKKLEKAPDFQGRLLIKGSIYKLPAEHQTILFRILQEALNNIVLHSGGNRVEVTMDFEPGDFVLSISDNGQGFDVEKRTNRKDSGLANMSNRSNLMGASFQICSKAGDGTRIEIKLPVTRYN